MTTSYHAKEVAVFVRQELKAAFPGQKFSVRSERHSVRVQWTDGPSTDEVKAITSQFSGMHFDGMQDMVEHSDRMYKGEKVSFYCYDPDLNHFYSVDVFKAAVEQTVNKNFVWKDVNVDELRYEDSQYMGAYLNDSPTDYTNGGYRNLDSDARKYLSSISFYNAPTSKATPAKAPDQTIATEAQAVTVTENNERDGVEIRFSYSLNKDELSALDKAGFKWSRFNSCWYAKRNADTLAFAASLEAQAEPAPTEVEPEVHLEMLAIAPAVEETEEWTAIEPIEVIQLELWGHVTYPKLNKNDTLERNNREIDDRSDTEECKVTEIVILSDKDYAQFCQSFLDDQKWLDGKGTTESHNEHLCPPVEHFFELSEMHQQLWREGAYDVAIAVTTPTADHILIVNPQGHSYARYVGNPCDELKQCVRNAIAPAKATLAFLPQAISQPSAYSGYTVVQEAVTYAPVVISGRSPQQELKDKLAALNVDALDAEQISLLLKAIG